MALSELKGKHEGLSGSNALGEVNIWFNRDIKNNIEGVYLEQQKLTALEITETMFNLLPIIKLEIADKGQFWGDLNLKIGDTITLHITPTLRNGTDADNEPTPFIDSVYCVQTIRIIQDNQKEMSRYEIFGIYNAQEYLNNEFTYPVQDNLSAVLTKEKRATEVIKEVLDTTTLKSDVRINSNDKMFWICHMTKGKFVDKLMKHCWIENDDAPMLFTNRNGKSILTSLKTIAKQDALVKFQDYAVIQGKNLATEEIEHLSMMYSNAVYTNIGGISLNKGGYTERISFYSPYGETVLDQEEFPIAEQGIMTTNRTLGYRYVKCDIIPTFSGMNSISNMQSSMKDTENLHSYGGIYFADLHPHYLDAEFHNEKIKRDFFTSFFKLTVDMGAQAPRYSVMENRPELGDCVFVDSSSQNYINKINTGKYVVCAIVHKYKKGFTYSANYYLASNGIYSGGSNA